MFEKFGQAAERLATSASRRQFLGRVGQGALVLAGALGSLLALPGGAMADRKPRACRLGSDSACDGLKEGDACSTATELGVCVSLKHSYCTCVPIGPPK